LELSIDFSTPGIICHDREKDNPQKRFYSVTTILLSRLMLRRKDPKHLSRAAFSAALASAPARQR
jgi:hypothetical protein